MSGRGRAHRHAIDERRTYADLAEGPFVRGPPRPHPALFEEEFQLQQIELRRLIADHHALIEDRVALQREVALGKDEIRRLNLIFQDFRAEKEAHIRELIEKGLKLEADVRATEHLRNEVMQLRAEIEKQINARQELSAKVQSLTQELARAQADNKQLLILRTDIDGLRQELMRVRTAFEYEKKGNIELMEQRQTMENNMISMARDIEKLRADLANTEGRPWAAGGAYGMKISSPEGAFRSSFVDGYNLHSGVSEKAPLYGPASGSWGGYDKSRLGRR
ncbi:protein FLX-like 3 [Typha angustifolia]|uniref:protein FLX-like 3 n=1 Tax=Typha angustifolia TaxID=59011 RepID=UPI003C2CB255